ncbi:hypothetical protein [Paenibacillus ehimensis]|uniref:Uncharacterized protein n=1 Tax=Paenibacillus ehimensis TaxID=79264 RepID=A0ABT8V4B7_9BACL|nr:hypothetical protein [Paenibacillus ehimensis]MDO3676272.1 hypothetical protein [Paenibacillus ehimensis]
MRKTFVVLATTATLLASVLAPAASFASDYFYERERNNNRTTADRVSVPVTIFGERNDVDGENDEDFFVFKAPSSGIYEFDMRVGSETDQDLYLYDQTGEHQIAHSFKSKGRDEYFSVFLNEGREYYVKVKHISGNENYTLNINS